MGTEATVVRIEYEYSDGSIKRAVGKDAETIAKLIDGMCVIESIHGRPYNGPSLQPVEPQELAALKAGGGSVIELYDHLKMILPDTASAMMIAKELSKRLSTPAPQVVCSWCKRGGPPTLVLGRYIHCEDGATFECAARKAVSE